MKKYLKYKKKYLGLKTEIVDENGYKYVGDINFDGMKHGHGIEYFPDGKIKYEGNWELNKYHGPGTEYIYTDGELTTYQGSYENGVIQGEGNIVYSDGFKYTGSIKDKIKDGLV